MFVVKGGLAHGTIVSYTGFTATFTILSDPLINNLPHMLILSVICGLAFSIGTIRRLL